MQGLEKWQLGITAVPVTGAATRDLLEDGAAFVMQVCAALLMETASFGVLRSAE
jgi:hypothetical protein